MLAHGSSLSLRTMSVPAVAVYATGTPPMTIECCVTDCSAFGGSFFAASAAGLSPGFSAGLSCASAKLAKTETIARRVAILLFKLSSMPCGERSRCPLLLFEARGPGRHERDASDRALEAGVPGLVHLSHAFGGSFFAASAAGLSAGFSAGLSCAAIDAAQAAATTARIASLCFKVIFSFVLSCLLLLEARRPVHHERDARRRGSLRQQGDQKSLPVG